MERARWTDDRLDEQMGSMETAIAELRSEMRGGFAALHTEIGGLRAELHTEIGGLRDELRDELRTEIGGLRGEFQAELRAFRADFAASQDRLATIGFALVGVLLTGMLALVIAVIA